MFTTFASLLLPYARPLLPYLLPYSLPLLPYLLPYRLRGVIFNHVYYYIYYFTTIQVKGGSGVLPQAQTAGGDYSAPPNFSAPPPAGKAPLLLSSRVLSRVFLFFFLGSFWRGRKKRGHRVGRTKKIGFRVCSLNPKP